MIDGKKKQGNPFDQNTLMIYIYIYIYEGHLKSSRPHLNFRFVAYLTNIYGPHQN